jgi:hypothetical protein
MGLHIAQLVTTCHVPRPFASHAGMIDQLARGRLAADLEAYLGPSLSSQPAIVRIRGLSIRVVIPAAELNQDSLSRAWTQAFGRALFAALAYPAGAGPIETFHADSLAAFVAGAIRARLDGSAAAQWQFAEFEEFFSQGVTEGAVALLCEWPWETLEILLELARAEALLRLLPRMDETQVERLFAALTAPGDVEPPALAMADLIAAVKLIKLANPRKVSALRSRRYAIQLYVAARQSGEPAPPLSVLYYSLIAVALLLDTGEGLGGGEVPPSGDGHRPVVVASLVEAIRRQFQNDPRVSSSVLLNAVLSDLRAQLKIPAPSALAEARWISTECCGLFFLLSTLDRLGWIPAWQDLNEFQTGGIAPLLAGLALWIVGQFETDPRTLDAGLALFSGYLYEPDLVHLRAVFQSYPPETATRVVRSALGPDRTAESWAHAFDQLAEPLLRAFAARIRGFRQASVRGIAHTFIQKSGRIRIEPERVVVIPRPSPFHVALHISGLDAPMNAVSWLSGRGVAFELEDL